MRRALGALGLIACTAQAGAQAIVTSAAPDSVSVSVYRDPERADDDKLKLDDLKGYALITETRRIAVPAGESVIRFEGVAGGIVPVSAIVTGLPGGIVEKNREARLISPAALIDGTLGHRVHIRRTSRATGTVTESEATILSAPGSGLVLRTPAGIEALYCAGLPETPVYSGLPAGLTNKPTLTVTTRSDRAADATVTLTYLADRFDWQADYVAHVAPDGRTLDLFAWLTLANGNGESFVGATAQVVAGEPNRSESEEGAPEPLEIAIACWLAGTTTSDLTSPALPAVMAPPAPVQMAAGLAEDIVVTGSRIQRRVMSTPIAVITAEQEDLGDLKLYRVPEPVTVAANAQKQVALLTKPHVPFERIHRLILDQSDETDDRETELVVRMKNKHERGLGIALPAGKVALFEQAGGRSMLVGEIPIRDLATGEDVELPIGESADVRVTQTETGHDDRDKRDPHTYKVAVSNAKASPVAVEIGLRADEDTELVRPSSRLGRKDGNPLWSVLVPANGKATLRYTVRDTP